MKKTITVQASKSEFFKDLAQGTQGPRGFASWSVRLR
jgi:hypothetical protein